MIHGYEKETWKVVAFDASFFTSLANGCHFWKKTTYKEKERAIISAKAGYNSQLIVVDGSKSFLQDFL